MFCDVNVLTCFVMSMLTCCVTLVLCDLSVDMLYDISVDILCYIGVGNSQANCFSILLCTTSILTLQVCGVYEQTSLH